MRWPGVVAAIVLVSLLATASDVSLSLDRDPIAVTREVIEGAESSLEAVVYKFDEKSLLEPLERALARGVRVRMVADAGEAKRGRSRTKALSKAGAEIRPWKPGKLHAKFLIVDGKRVLSGSYNWTESAENRNVELLLDFDAPDVVKAFGQRFERLWDLAAEQ